MGYLKRSVRRSAARSDKLAFLDRARDIHPSGWKHCDPSIRPARDTYLRFAIEHPRVGRIGLFRSSDILEEADDLPASVRAEVESVFRWFSENLPAPRRLPVKAVCWFRADAADRSRG
jgi:hypothetical protein